MTHTTIIPQNYVRDAENAPVCGIGTGYRSRRSRIVLTPRAIAADVASIYRLSVSHPLHTRRGSPDVFTVDAGNVGFRSPGVSQPDVTHTTIIPPELHARRSQRTRTSSNGTFTSASACRVRSLVSHGRSIVQCRRRRQCSLGPSLFRSRRLRIQQSCHSGSHDVNAGNACRLPLKSPEPTITFSPAAGTGLGMYRFLAAQDPALIAQVLDSVNGQGAMVGIGALGSETLKCLVQEIRPLNELAAQVKLVPLGNDIHAAETGPLPPYDPRIAIPGAGSEFSARLLLQAFESAQAANGADGEGYEAIYRRTSDNTAPAGPTTTTAQREMNRFVPAGWTDNPGRSVADHAVRVDLPPDWNLGRLGRVFRTCPLGSLRRRTAAGVEYIFRRTATATAPTSSSNHGRLKMKPMSSPARKLEQMILSDLQLLAAVRMGELQAWNHGKLGQVLDRLPNGPRYGADGMGFEFIFRTTTNDSAPARPTTTTTQDQTDDHIPSGWTDDPTGVGAAMPYEWSCVPGGYKR